MTPLALALTLNNLHLPVTTPHDNDAWGSDLGELVSGWNIFCFENKRGFMMDKILHYNIFGDVSKRSVLQSLYVSYRVSNEKKSQDSSFATLYLLKDNNNGHNVITSG